MFGFPAHSKADNFRFRQNLLQTVTFQVKYRGSNPVSSLTSEIVTVLVEFLPVVRQLQKNIATVQASTENRTQLISNEIKPDGLQFSLAENTKVFVVTDDTLTMTFVGTIYTFFAEAQEEFNSLIQKIIPILNIESYSRVAIRKINALNCELDNTINASISWLSVMSDVFTSALIGHVIDSPAKLKLTSSVVNSRFNDENNYLTLIYGILPKEVEPGVKQVVLDIDLANQDEHTSLASVKSKMLEINSELFNIFMWAIRPELRDIMIS